MNLCGLILPKKKLIGKKFPLTPQQLVIYNGYIKNPKNTVYNISFMFHLKKNIDMEKLKFSLFELIKRNKVFQSKYITIKDTDKNTFNVFGLIEDDCTLKFENYTYNNCKKFVRPFDLGKAPLIRVGFIENDIILFDIHHIIFDGLSVSLVHRELNNYYYNKIPNGNPIQFSDYAIDFRNTLKRKNLNDQIEFYKKMFNNNKNYNILNFPKKDTSYKSNELKNKPEFNENEIGKLSKIIKQDTAKIINKYIEKNGVNKVAFFISIYGYIMSKYSGQSTIYTSILDTNRNNVTTKNLIGLLEDIKPLLIKYWSYYLYII
ncbi:hypothetical protein PIROE2DRAFT_59767 [Piromyces sp. E2]|nr:hypothetical protein PIROE2DRAFT_59767 [Piromyces sp. E2]|eukprot:OUM65781.1 hypothetical protein PIROE2DRAFT_59767 [Piromyces sp. E2]